MSKSQRVARTAALAVCTAGAIGASPAAFAQAFDAVRLYGAAPGEDGGTVGLALIAGREYPGSDERRTLVVPALDYQWANGWFAGFSNGIGYNFSRQPKLQYGLRVTADLGRDESRSDALRGLGDIDAAAEFGGFFNVNLSREFFLTSSLRYGSGNDGKGLSIDLGAGHSSEIAPQWRLGLGASLTLMNDEAMQSWFGVTPAQAAASGYAVYSPGAGARDLRANAALTHMVSPRASVTLVVSVSTLLGDAQDSPLVRSRTAATGVLAAAYAF